MNLFRHFFAANALKLVRFLAASLALAWISAAPLHAAEMRPPLQELRNPTYTLIVAERLDQAVEEGRMTVRVIEVMRGDREVSGEIELLVEAGDPAYVEPGVRYLLFYSDVERVNFKPRAEVRRPDRRRLLHIEGADPAVFPDTPAMRVLLDPAHSENEKSPGYRDVVMAGLGSDDPAMVDLWSAEWALRPATFGDVKASEAELLRGIAEDASQRSAARARILLFGSERSGPEEVCRFARSATRVLERTEPELLIENTGLSQLIYASLSVVRKHPDPASPASLEKWLKATPPLAENAALALRAIDPDLERTAVQTAIADEGTPEPTRTFLADHMRRLELADERS